MVGRLGIGGSQETGWRTLALSRGHRHPRSPIPQIPHVLLNFNFTERHIIWLCDGFGWVGPMQLPWLLRAREFLNSRAQLNSSRAELQARKDDTRFFARRSVHECLCAAQVPWPTAYSLVLYSFRGSRRRLRRA